MSYLTYRQLIEHSKYFTKEQLDQTVTIFDVDDDEYFPCNGISITQEDGVLDKKHIILIIKKDEE